MDSINHRNLLLSIDNSKKRIVRTHVNYNFTIRDKILKKLIKILQKYDASSAETIARSIVLMDGIINMNMNYLAAALYLYEKNDTIFNKKGNKKDKIVEKLFDDDSLYIKNIKNILNKTIKADNEEIWIRRKQNILVYLEIILNYKSTDHEIYEYQFDQNNDHEEEEEEDEEEKYASVTHNSVIEQDD
jgi:hypothetical protein